jgi:uncharacterized protein
MAIMNRGGTPTVSLGFDPRTAAIFYAIAFVLAVAVAIAAREASEAFIILYMFTPSIALLTLHIAKSRAGSVRRGLLHLAERTGLLVSGRSRWPFALLVPPILLGAVTLLVVALGIADFVPFAGATQLAALPFSVVLSLAFGVVLAFGEEVGWRGYLLPALVSLGVWPAMLLSGLLHGLWHLPVILLTPFYHADGARLIVIPEFLLMITLAGIVYGYLRLTTGSVWPVILLHAAFNESLGRYSETIESSDPALLEYLGAESGLFTLIAVALVIAWIVHRWPLPRYA